MFGRERLDLIFFNFFLSKFLKLSKHNLPFSRQSKNARIETITTDDEPMELDIDLSNGIIPTDFETENEERDSKEKLKINDEKDGESEQEEQFNDDIFNSDSDDIKEQLMLEMSLNENEINATVQEMKDIEYEEPTIEPAPVCDEDNEENENKIDFNSNWRNDLNETLDLKSENSEVTILKNTTKTDVGTGTKSLTDEPPLDQNENSINFNITNIIDLQEKSYPSCAIQLLDNNILITLTGENSLVVYNGQNKDQNVIKKDSETIKFKNTILSEFPSPKAEILRFLKLWFRNVTGIESWKPEMTHRNRK